MIKMVLIKSRRGYLFTIATIILIIPLIYLVSFYGGVSETPMEDTIGRIRCDELHYFVEDVKVDMERAVTIFGRRAAVYVEDMVVLNEQYLQDYTFNCTSHCHVDCTTFIRPENGSEAAIAEMIVCGTFNGENVTKMQNHTLPDWIWRITEAGESMRFDVNITPYEIRIVPMDAWHFAVIIDNKMRVSDREGLCFYKESIMTAISNSSIIGIPDPLHHMLNMERKDILPCENPLLPRKKAGCGVNGSGIGGGRAVFYTYIFEPPCNPALLRKGYRAYCNGSSSTLPPAGDVQDQVFVLNKHQLDPLCNPPGMKECFNASMPRHFSAFVAYQDIAPGNITKCSITIPYIVGTGDLDDIAPPNMGPPDPDCNDTKIRSGDPILVLNIPSPCDYLLSRYPSLHYVLLGYNSDETDFSCYYVSDIENYNPNCTSVNLSNGPCFFDRLDGNLNLSQRYVEQANETFGTTAIGMESLVDIFLLHELKYLNNYTAVIVNSTYSWVDYLYWQNITGCDVCGYCKSEIIIKKGKSANYSFMLDCPHAHGYGLDTECDKVSVCPVCGDGFCASLEDCVICLNDCKCPGCPVFANLTDCKWGCGAIPPITCNVTFNLSIRDQNGHLMNLSAKPYIDITTIAPAGSSIHEMNQTDGETGKYHYIKTGIAGGTSIKGSIRIREPDCPFLKNATAFMLVGGLPGC